MKKINYENFEGCTICGDLECKCGIEPKPVILKPKKSELKRINGSASVDKIGWLLTPEGVRLVEVVEMTYTGFKYYYLLSDLSREYKGYCQGAGTWFYKLSEEQRNKDLFELYTGPEVNIKTEKIPFQMDVISAIEGLEIANKKLGNNSLEYFKNRMIIIILNHFKDENIKEIEIESYRKISNNISEGNIKEYKASL